MKNPNQHIRFSLLLMASSLFLLSIFLGLWLRQAWQQARNDLQKELNFTFSNSIQNVKSQLFAEAFPLSFERRDTSDKVEVHLKLMTQSGDSKKPNPVVLDKMEQPLWVKGRTKKGRIKKVTSDSVVIDSIDQAYITAFAMELDSGQTMQKMVFGEKKGIVSTDIQASLAFLMAMKNGEVGNGMEQYAQQDSSIMALIGQQFDAVFVTKNRNIPTQLVVLNQDDLLSNTLLSDPYEDFLSHRKYAVAVTGYQPYLLKKIIPQILFSLVLFCSIVAAFLSIYQNLRRQQRLTALKNDFISNITHELKTPITTVGVAIEALSNFNALKNPERTQEYLQISKHELHRLSILVDKVLKMSLFEQKEPELKLEPLNLKNLIQDILASFQLQFDRKAAQVNFNTSGSDFNLTADKTHLTSVVYNLVDNALKYSQQSPQIQIQLIAQNEALQMSVQDNGIGIEADYLNKIFDKFFRVPTGNSHNVKGHGLGLSYVASVVNQHNGKIEVQSTLGEGSNFTLYFPRSK